MFEPEEPSVSSPTTETEEASQIQQAAMSIDISSKANLELTVTKTALEILNNLGKAFSNAIAMGTQKAIVTSAPYKVKNESGFKITLCLNKGAFKVDGQNDSVEVVLESGAEVPLQLKVGMETSTSMHLEEEKSLGFTNVVDRFLYVRVSNTVQHLSR